MKNTSGLQPVEFKVLVEPEAVEEVSAGGIVMIQATTEREKMKQVKGKMIAVGGNAFYDWMEPRPKVGDTVLFAKFAGLMTTGADDREYRVLNDKDITAVVS